MDINSECCKQYCRILQKVYPTVVINRLIGEEQISILERGDMQWQTIFTPKKTVLNSSYSSSDVVCEVDKDVCS